MSIKADQNKELDKGGRRTWPVLIQHERERGWDGGRGGAMNMYKKETGKEAAPIEPQQSAGDS